MKKGFILMLVFSVLFAFTAAGTVDAKRGGMKSPRQSFTQTPKKSTENVQKSSPNTTAGAAAGTTAGRGFFSGGSMMKGLMIGGLAGLMFGSMFSGMGFMGNFFGLIINLLAIYILFMVIRSIVVYFRNKRKATTNDRRGPY
jgi:predicted lipid-binding transport protein (Tim44 family)